jgi:RNA polymerase sigma-70 factor (TIGR02960 family)
MTAVKEGLLLRAISGDERAFEELTEPHRRELEFHCYRMLGSVHDAEDVLQETLVAAWNGLSAFERRASLRTWLYRIATNRCLNALRDAGRRPAAPLQSPFPLPAPTRNADPGWLEPYPDDRLSWLPDLSPGPESRYETRETVEIAFIAALQRLTGRQRAALVLHDVLGFRAGEVAAMIESSEDGVKGALKRARAALDQELGEGLREPPPAPDSELERELVEQFVDAFVDNDIERLVSLLTDSAWLTMPPATAEYQGRAAIASFLRALASWRSGHGTVMRAAPRANGQPAVAVFRTDPADGITRGSGLIVFGLSGARISNITWFLGPQYHDLAP